MKWKVEYWGEDAIEFDVEWWTVSDGTKSFRTNSEANANWLAEQLNKMEGE